MQQPTFPHVSCPVNCVVANLPRQVRHNNLTGNQVPYVNGVGSEKDNQGYLPG